MRLQSLLTLINGTLLNKPAINSFDGLSFSSSKVKRGNLYVSMNGNFFDEAVHNGAYVILYDKDIQITDKEIAWVRVSSLENALVKLIRYYLSEKNILGFNIDIKTHSLLKSLSCDTKLFYLDDLEEQSVEKLYKLSNNSIVLSTDKKLLGKFFSQTHPLLTNTTPLQIKSKEVFYVSFIYKNIYYDRVQISSFFIPSLQSLISLFEENEIKFSLKQIYTSSHFELQFIDRFLNSKDFGKSERAIIFEKDISLAKDIFIYFQKNAPWAHVIGLFPDKIDLDNSLNYIKTSEIPILLSNERFEYAIIAGVDKSLLENETFNLKPTQPSLI